MQPRRQRINRAVIIVGALLFSFAVIGIGGSLPVNIVVLSGFLILYIKGLPHALLWSATAGLIFETVSPFPSYVFVAALLLSLTLTYYFLRHYLTHRTLLGIFVGSFLGVVVFEGLLLLLGKAVRVIAYGITPNMDGLYLGFVVSRVIWSTVLLTAVYRMVRSTNVKVGIMV